MKKLLLFITSILFIGITNTFVFANWNWSWGVEQSTIPSSFMNIDGDTPQLFVSICTNNGTIKSKNYISLDKVKYIYEVWEKKEREKAENILKKSMWLNIDCNGKINDKRIKIYTDDDRWLNYFLAQPDELKDILRGKFNIILNGNDNTNKVISDLEKVYKETFKEYINNSTLWTLALVIVFISFLFIVIWINTDNDAMILFGFIFFIIGIFLLLYVVISSDN